MPYGLDAHFARANTLGVNYLRESMKYSADKRILENDDLAQVAWDAIEPLWDDFPYSNTKKCAAFLAQITEGQKALLTIDWCQKEIRNGGVKQLLSNSTGGLIPYAVEGFKLIGANVYAEILEKIIGLFQNSYPETAGERKKELKGFSVNKKNELEKLDNEFFNLLFSEEYDIEKYRGNYVKNNPELFTSS